MPNLCLKLSFPSFVLLLSLAPRPACPPSSVSSAKGGLPWPGGAQTCSPSSTYRYRSLAQPASASTRLSSVSSHDSGFISQDAAYSKPPSPMPSDITSQVQWAWRGMMLLGLSFPIGRVGTIHQFSAPHQENCLFPNCPNLLMSQLVASPEKCFPLTLQPPWYQGCFRAPGWC